MTTTTHDKSDDDLEALVQEAEAARADARETGQHEQELEPLFVFGIGNTHLALEASKLLTIAAPQTPVPLPRAPQHVLGLIPYGDSTLPIVDLAAFLQLASEQGDTQNRLLVIRDSGMSVGLLCDQVLGVRTIHSSALAAPQLLKGGRLPRYLRQEILEGALPVGLLDVATLLEDARVRLDA